MSKVVDILSWLAGEEDGTGTEGTISTSYVRSISGGDIFYAAYTPMDIDEDEAVDTNGHIQ